MAENAILNISKMTYEGKLIKAFKHGIVSKRDCEYIEDTDEFLREPQCSAMLNMLNEWNFPIFDLSQKVPTKVLTLTAYQIFDNLWLFHKFPIPVDKFINFVYNLEHQYGTNPYHNSVHATDVIQGVYWLLMQRVDCVAEDGSRKKDFLLHAFEPLETLALCLAAVCHDFQHRGVTNGFLVATGDPLSIQHNDRSVLENHHAAASWVLLTNPGCDFLQQLTKMQQQTVRWWMLHLILATDMAHHAKHLVEFNKKCQAGIDWTTEADRLLVSSMLLKMADLGGPCREWHLHEEWTRRITTEFFMQGDAEASRGMEVSVGMDRHTTKLAHSQQGFLTRVVEPLCHSLHEAGLLPSKDGICAMVDNLQRNLAIWKDISLTEEFTTDEEHDW